MTVIIDVSSFRFRFVDALIIPSDDAFCTDPELILGIVVILCGVTAGRTSKMRRAVPLLFVTRPTSPPIPACPPRLHHLDTS
jgi:hypothetical protein